MNVKADRKNSIAFVWLPTPKDAREAAAETVQINGEDYEVSLQYDGKEKKRKRGNILKANDDVDGESSEDGSGSEDSDIDVDENVDSEDVEESD